MSIQASTCSTAPAGIDCIDEGAGDPVILIHGGASNNRQWKALIERLCASLPGEVSLVGHSCGGVFAMQAAGPLRSSVRA